jgi:nitrite reductase (NADH) large subunit
VIGGGLLGLEAARGLLTHGVEVTVLEAAPQLMAVQLDPEAGDILRKTIEAMGIRVLCNTITTRIARTGTNGTSRLTHLEFKDGTSLETDMVVVSAGIRPITEIATASGITVNRGIVCDDQMRTSDPAIFSVGECVEHRGQLYGLVDPIWEQAQVLADVITETRTESAYLGSKLGTKLKVMGVELHRWVRPNPRVPRTKSLSIASPHTACIRSSSCATIASPERFFSATSSPRARSCRCSRAT